MEERKFDLDDGKFCEDEEYEETKNEMNSEIKNEMMMNDGRLYEILFAMSCATLRYVTRELVSNDAQIKITTKIPTFFFFPKPSETKTESSPSR